MHNAGKTGMGPCPHEACNLMGEADIKIKNT